MNSIRNLILSIIAALSVLFCAPAMASFSGTIVWLTVKSDGSTTIYMSGNTGHGSCGASSNYWAVKDETSVAGKAQIAMLLLAQNTGRTVVLTGLSTCSRVSGVEDIGQVDLL